MDILWVVKTHQEANFLKSNTPDNVHVVPALGMTGGRRVDIVLMNDILFESDVERKKYEEWVKTCIVTKLVPSGRIFMGVSVQDVMNYES